MGASPAISRGDVTVAYIAGYGRSGSTVLDLLLGASEGSVAAGELFMFFRPGEARDCSCGQPVADCPFWSQVRREVAVVRDDKLGLEFRSRMEGLFSPIMLERAHETQAEYVGLQRALIEGVAKAAGRRIVVDSSKTANEVAWRPRALSRRCGIKIKLIHLVRDGRAVMWSVMRGCNRKLERGERDPRLSFPRLRSAVGWTLANLVAWWQGLLLPRGSAIRVSYEDLVRDPTAELSRIGTFLDLDLTSVIARLAAHEPIPPGHSLSGNRIRHTGVVELREDDEWRSELSFSSRLLYWLLAGPTHLCFVRSRRPRKASSSPEPASSPSTGA